MIAITITLDLNCFVVFQIPKKLSQVRTTIIGQDKNHLLDIFQIIHKTTEHFTINIDQRFDIFQVIRINIVIKKRKKWHLTNTMPIAL